LNYDPFKIAVANLSILFAWHKHIPIVLKLCLLKIFLYIRLC